MSKPDAQMLDRMAQAKMALAAAQASSNHIHERIIEIRALRAEQETMLARDAYIQQELALLAQAELANRNVAQCLTALMGLQAEIAGITL